MKQLTLQTSDFDKMEKHDRARFINSLSGAKSANLLGSVDAKGQPNLSIVSSCVHLGANPALMGMVIRPRSVPRHSFDNILELGFWTINHVHEGIVKPAHQTSARYPKEKSEFEAVGLNEEYIGDFKAPFVKEASIRLGMKLVQVIPIPMNDTEFVVGEIVLVNFPESCFLKDGALDLASQGTVSVTGLDFYHKLDPISRLSYAKVDQELSELDRKPI